MTTVSVFKAVVRRWYVALLGLVATALTVATLLTHQGVYWTQVSVVFVAPHGGNQETDATLVSSSGGLIAVAGLVEREVNAGRPTGAPTSTEVPLIYRGIRHGSRVLLPNAGGQFDYHFVAPELSVQAAGPTPHEAITLRNESIVEIQRTLRRMQAADGIRPKSRITTHMAPPPAPVMYANGHRSRAVAVATMLGLCLTVLFSVLADRLPQALRRLRARVEPSRRA